MAVSVAARPGEWLDRVRWMAAGILIVVSYAAGE